MLKSNVSGRKPSLFAQNDNAHSPDEHFSVEEIKAFAQKTTRKGIGIFLLHAERCSICRDCYKQERKAFRQPTTRKGSFFSRLWLWLKQL